MDSAGSPQAGLQHDPPTLKLPAGKSVGKQEG
jgi:hypothetical protein